MFFSAKPMNIQIKQRKQATKSNRIFSSPQSQINTLIADLFPMSVRQAWSHEKGRLSDCLSSSRLAYQWPAALTANMRNRSLIQFQSKQLQKRRTYQVLMRQTLRRTQIKNKKPNTNITTNQNTNKAKNSKKNIKQKSQQNILDYLSELQGKKCTINSTKKLQKQKITKKSKSCQTKQRPKKQLKIYDQQQKLIEQKDKSNDLQRDRVKDRNKQKIQSIGFYVSKKTISKNCPKSVRLCEEDRVEYHPHIHNIKPKLDCYNYNCYENQNNFIRAKFKSNCLSKKMSYLQRQQRQSQDLRRTCTHSRRNNNNKGLMLKGLGQAQINTIDSRKSDQNTKISGWQITYENQSGFCKDMLVQLK